MEVQPLSATELNHLGRILQGQFGQLEAWLGGFSENRRDEAILEISGQWIAGDINKSSIFVEGHVNIACLVLSCGCISLLCLAWLKHSSVFNARLKSIWPHQHLPMGTGLCWRLDVGGVQLDQLFSCLACLRQFQLLALLT